MDPLFLHELALELGMTVQQMTSQMSAHELCVSWPLFFQWRERDRERRAAQNQAQESFG